MSRIGRKPIIIPGNVTVTVADGLVAVKGPKGELSFKLPKELKIANEAGRLDVTVSDSEISDNKNSLWGTARSVINNMVKGVVEGYEKKMEIEGVGFKAQLQGDKLILNVGFSHPVEITAPAGISFKVEKNAIFISGTDKFLVGLVAAQVRKVKKPEPHKGKGIRYAGEIIRRKAGKKASASAA